VKRPAHLLQSKQLYPFLKSCAFGALTGVVFAIGIIALPGVGIIFLISFYNIGWDLSWFPSAFTIAFAGAGLGGVIAGGLYIKDKYVPYVEAVPDFEADAEDDRFAD
jgi:hypothetical protein